MLHYVNRALGALICAFSFIAPTFAQPLRVALDIHSSSWVPGAKFDQADFVKRCEQLDVRIAGNEPIAGRIVVDYQESQGRGYSKDPFGKADGFGTYITYKLSVLSPDDKRVLVTLKSDARTADQPKSLADLHASAIASFTASYPYTLSCRIARAALGSRRDAEELLKWAVERGKISKTTFRALKYVPQSSRDKAFVAVINRDFSAGTLAKYKQEIVEPLVMFISSHHKGAVYGENAPTCNPYEDLATLPKAIEMLAQTGDERAIPAIRRFIETCEPTDPRATGHVSMVLPVAIRMLGQYGGDPELSLLRRLFTREPPIGAAALTAAEDLRTRLQPKK